MTMKSSLSFAAAAALANAQSIIECNPSTSQLCANDFNRTCYNYTLTSTHDCTTCLNGFIEYDDECYSIVDLQNGQFFNIVSKMIEMYTPEYADTTISTEERAYRLLNVSSIISYWESLVPTVEFSLKLNSESVLTLEERVKRLGVNNAITFDLDNQVDDVGRGGIMERFIVEGVNDELDDVAADGAVDSSATNPSSRRLAGAAATNTKNNQLKKKQAHRRMQDTPPAIDWHSSGYTTTVKNQGYCGCCWAVSTTAAIESALMITNKMNKFDAMTSNSLSFQQMISCDESNLGCDGGNILYAAKYAWEHNDFDNDNYGGLVSASDYPYEDFLGRLDASKTTCDTAGKSPVAFLNFPKVVTSVSDRSSFETRRDLMMAAVAQQPVTMTLKSGCDLFMSYSSGVLTHDVGCECCDKSCIDHAVVIVGYNTTHDIPYWKIRNSWGSGWGEAGHVRIAMNQYGCGWGLFGMLSEGALLEDVYTSKDALPERPSWWARSSTGAKVLVILGSVVGFCVLFTCVCIGFRKYRKSE